ncbi:hypothetical protein VP01_1316g2, partial [Puccinia sorghi]
RRKEAGSQNKHKKEKKNRKAVQEKTGLPNQSMIWHQVKFSQHNLYFNIPWLDNKPTPCLPHSQGTSIIAFIEFTPFNKLTPSEKDDLHFISTFLHNSKQIISPVPSCYQLGGGVMCRLAQILQQEPNSWMIHQPNLGLKIRLLSILIIASPLGLVRLLVTFLTKHPHEPFQKNHNLMKKYNLPSFSDLSYDSEDISQFAFEVNSCPFLFPDHKFGIEFDHQNGIVKMIWQANKYRHCTIPHFITAKKTFSTAGTWLEHAACQLQAVEQVFLWCISQDFCRLGMSVQINCYITNSCIL